MAKLRYTGHARSRMVERGFRWEDIRLIVACGTVGERGRHQIGDRDIAREMERHSGLVRALTTDQPHAGHARHRSERRIKRVRRLNGAVVVVRGRTVVTCFGPGGHPAHR